MGSHKRRQFLSQFSGWFLGSLALQSVAAAEVFGGRANPENLLNEFQKSSIIPKSETLMSAVSENIRHQASKNQFQNECNSAMQNQFQSSYIDSLVGQKRAGFVSDLFSNLSPEEQKLLFSLKRPEEQAVLVGFIEKLLQYRSKHCGSLTRELDQQMREFAVNFVPPVDKKEKA